MKPKQPGTPASVAEKNPPAGLIDLGLSDYRATYDLQVALVEKIRKEGQEDLFLMTEHPSVFTLGKRGGRENLTVSEQFLSSRNIPLVHIERGGDITYHGEGQLVLYPVINLRRSGLSVTGYVYLLEEVMIRLAGLYGVTAIRDKRNHGIWVENSKLGSVGIAIRHGISFHGLSFNTNLSLEPFSWVNPCGLKGVKMTSLSTLCDREVTVAMVKIHLKRVLTELFQRDFTLYRKDHIHAAIYRKNDQPK
jgi:lipoyl(octanoyl) transferase